MDIEDILGPGGLISKYMPEYEHRPQQIEAAKVIERALLSKKHSIVEAGTGVGKSMAYLLPAIQHALAGKKVVVSTHTIYLQSQLLEKDIPFLQKILPIRPLKVELVKGRSNYLCLSNFDAELGQMSLVSDPNLERFRKWSNETKTGDVAELDFPFSNWSDVCADQDTCRGNDCTRQGKCFYFKMRRAALEADIIITNHALFFSDLAIRISNPKFAILPDYDAVVFDEAHHLEDVATKVFGVECASFFVPSVIGKVRRLRGLPIDPIRLQTIEDLNQEIFQSFTKYSKQEFFISEVYEREGKDRIETAASSLCSMLDGLVREFATADVKGKPELEERLTGLKRTCTRLKEEISTLFFGPLDGYFKWGERSANSKYQSCFLRHSPLTVADILPDALWKEVETVVLTSATLSNSGTFNYIKGRLGMPECIETIQDSPFDFMKQCLLYIPRHLDFPSELPQYTDQVANEIEQLVRASGGRAFLLFTSYRMMNAVYERLLGRLPYVMMKQGDMANEELVKEFSRQGNACLFGVHSFWEGVDIRGEALSCVVIDKLPFSVPTSPVNRARMDALVSGGGEGFSQYSVPQAQIRLKQGFGRLIRTKTDRGVVAILDSRLVKKTYGREFIRFLPRCPITIKLDDVRSFYRKPRG